MRYEWILFDADGTLFDFERAQAAAIEETWRACGLDERPGLAAEFRAINVELWPAYERGAISQETLRIERFRRMMGETGRDPEEVSELYLDRLAERAELIEGAGDAVRSLQGRAGLALVTNGIAGVQHRRLDRSGLRPLFETVVISSEVGHAKPQAGFFDETFARIGFPPREAVLMVGDNLDVDMKGGSDYGTGTCWINPRGEPRRDDIRIDHELEAVRDLAALLDALDGAGPPFPSG